ncbi:MAG: FHIPEP family type III secretion protein [bacterium]
MDSTPQNNGNRRVGTNGDIAARFVMDRWKPKLEKRVGDLEVRVSQATPGTTPDDLNQSLDPVISLWSERLGLPKPELLFEESTDLSANEFEIRLAGATRFAGSFTTSWFDWWAEHPVPGPFGRVGLTMDGTSGGSPPWNPVHQLSRAVEEVLWDDPGLLLATTRGVKWATDSLADMKTEPEAFNGLQVMRELASRRLPLLDRGALRHAIEEAAVATEQTALAELLISQLLPNKILIRLGNGLATAASYTDPNSQLQATLLPMMRDGLYYELGIAFGKIEFENADDLPSFGYQITVNGLPRGGGTAREKYIFVNTPAKDLTEGDSQPGVNPANGYLGSWIKGETIEGYAGEHAGWSQVEYLVLHLSACLREAAGEFSDLAWTEQTLNQLQTVFPKLVTTVRAAYPNERLACVFGRLVSEGFSIRDLPRVLNRLMEFDELANSALVLDEPDLPAEVDWSRNDPVALTEYVRCGLKDYITHSRTRGSATLEVYLLDSTSIEAGLQLVMRDKSKKDPIYDFPEAGPFLRNLREALTKSRALSQNPSLLTTNELRPHLRRLIAAQFPRLPVISYQELSPVTNILPRERLTL